MLLTTAISLFFGLWSSLLLIDYYLRSFNVTRYVRFAHRIGLNISFFQLRFYTYRCDERASNKGISVRLSNTIAFLRVSQLISAWFLIGAIMALFSLCAMTLYMSKQLFDEFSLWRYAQIHYIEPISAVFYSSKVTLSTAEATHSQTTNRNTALTAVIPGLNMPWWHLPLFIGVCLLAGIVHELGHALAAVHFNVPVSGFGIFLFIIYPGAFTEIDSDALSTHAVLFSELPRFTKFAARERFITNRR